MYVNFNIHSNYEKGKKELTAQAAVDMVADGGCRSLPNVAQQRVDCKRC
jgi:hypothetical protein